jgi:hypothetical protein
MAPPRGYRGRHTGLYRDTEGKQPRARNLRTNSQAPKSARRAAQHECAASPPATAGLTTRADRPAAPTVTMIMDGGDSSRETCAQVPELPDSGAPCAGKVVRSLRATAVTSRRPR